MSEWQPIESAPKDGTLVLLFVPKGVDAPVSIGCYDGDSLADSWLVMEPDFMASWCIPTHWQPLPTPPEERKE